MRFLELLLVILVITIDYKLPPAQRISESDKLDKMSEGRLHRGWTRWTDWMCIDLINSRKEAKLLQDSDDCPIKENGRKIGIMELTLKFWNQKGYEDLGKSAQNLRDKLAYLERTCKLDTARIYVELQEQRENNGQDIDSNNWQEHEDLNKNATDNNNEAANELAPEDLSRVNEITQVAKEIYEDIVTVMGSIGKERRQHFCEKDLSYKECWFRASTIGR